MKNNDIKNEDITISIVLYKEPFDIIYKTLEKLKSFNIIIIDNDNNDELIKKIEKFFYIEKYVLNKINSGFSSGYNQAIRLCKSKFCLILGPDCVIEKNDILKLKKSLEKYEECFLVSPTSYDKNENLTYTGGPLPENFPKDKILQISGDTCVESVLGACMLVKTKDINDIGMFDENFFLYFSDDDLCRKVKKIHKTIIQVFNAKCIHTHGNIKVNNKYYRTFIREYNLIHDSLYYFHKNKDEKYFQRNKKKIKSYFFKLLVKLLTLNILEFVKIFSKILAYYRFYFKFKWRGGRVV